MGKPLLPPIAWCVGCGDQIESPNIFWRDVDCGERVSLCQECGALFHRTFTAPAAILDAQRLIRQTRWWLDLWGVSR